MNILGDLFCRRMRDSKAGAGIQDERSECLSARRGREYFVFYKRSEIKNLVTRDRIPHLHLVIFVGG
jgi:hypothetical protein